MTMQSVDIGFAPRAPRTGRPMLWLAPAVAGAALLAAALPAGAGTCTGTGVTTAQLADWGYAAPPAPDARPA